MCRSGWSDDEAAAIRARAHTQLDEAQTVVNEISRQRLAQLTAGPRSVALNAIDDRTLTAADRERLIRHVARGKRRFARKGWLSSSSFASLRVLPLGWRSGAAIIAVGLLAVPILAAWSNTPLGRVTLTRETIIRWNDEGDYVGMTAYPAGAKFDVLETNNGDATIRVRGWLPGKGYRTAMIPWSAVTR